MSVKSHGDSQWLSEFCRDASQESTTLEAGYTFIKTQIQTAVLQYLQKKGNDPLNWGLTEAVPPNPWASHYKLQEFVDHLWVNQWPASTHMVIHKANHRSEKVSTITSHHIVTYIQCTRSTAISHIYVFLTKQCIRIRLYYAHWPWKPEDRHQFEPFICHIHWNMSKNRFYVMAAINRLRRIFLSPENSILFYVMKMSL